MSPERWRQVRQIFDAAVDSQPADTERVLREACAGDSELYDEVRRLLEVNERTSQLDQPVWEDKAGGVFAAGQTVAGRYQILRFLSRGGMGEVYEAQDLELGERVALKTLLPEIAGDVRMIGRFKQEIQLSRKIAHPNVCRVFDLARHPADGSSRGTVFFLTMEFLDGETLSARLEREGRMSPADALPLVQQMAAALDAAHHAGIIHRDFKSSNVMLVESAASTPVRVVVTDFGLARAFTGQAEVTASMSGRVMGTLDYMSPELLTGAQASVASDIYALGMVAYRIVTGALPFASDTPLAGIILRSKQPIPSPKAFATGLDLRWERAILRALDASPGRRYSSAAAFVQALRGESNSITLALPVMTRRKWVEAAAALAIVAAGWIGWEISEYRRLRLPSQAEMFYRQGLDDIDAGAYFAATKALEEAVKAAPHYPLAHARLAEAWLELQSPEKALDQMLLARREDLSRLSRADKLQIEAIDLTSTREFAAAAGKYEEISRIDDRESLSQSVDLGRAYEKAGKPDKAIESYRRAAEGPAHNPAAWLRLGVLYSRASDYAKSEKAFAEAERIYQLSSNLEGLTEVAFERGVSADRRQQFTQAAEYLGKALETAHLSADGQMEIRARMQLATNAYAAGDPIAAERYSREALATAQSNGLETQAMAGLQNLGNAYLRKADFAGAEKYYNDALALARTRQSTRYIALSLLLLGSLHDQQHRPANVIAEIQEALPYFESNRFIQETFACYTLLGRAQVYRGNPQEALADGNRLLAMGNASGSRSQIALAHELLADAQYELQNFPVSLEESRKSVDPTLGEERLAYDSYFVGKSLRELGRFPEAQSQFDAAEAHGRKFPVLTTTTAKGRAIMALYQGRPSDAAALARQTLPAVAGQDASSELELDAILGRALIAQGNAAEGLAVCRRSEELAARLGSPDSLLTAQAALLEAEFAVHDIEAGRQTFAAIQPQLDARPETRCHVLALLARADPKYAPAARKALDRLRELWGQDNWETWLKRPDNQRLMRPVLQPLYAK